MESIVYGNEKIKEKKKSPKNKKGLGAVAAAVIAALAKIKGVLIIFFTKFKILFSILKISKFGATAVSMLATIGIYAMQYGFWYAAGFVGLIFIHEMGHYAVAKKVGLEVSGPIFIPFIGALINMKNQPKDAIIEAEVGYGGPFWGTIGALIALIIFWFTGSKLALSLAYAGFLLNLFNLIPVEPLDGGRVVAAISPYLWFIGIPILVYFIFVSFNPVLILIGIFGIKEAYKLWKNRDEDYYNIPSYTRLSFGFYYFGLLVADVIGLYFTMNVLGRGL